MFALGFSTRLEVENDEKGYTTSSSMQYVFDDILLKILIIVGPRSLREHFSAKIVLKKFKEIADDYFETVNLLRSWVASNKVSTFINHYIQCRNFEALYMLKSAISESCQVARNVYGAILVCHRLDSKHEGLKLLYSLNCHSSRQLSVMECQERFQLCLSYFLVHREVRTQTLKLHQDNAATKPCNDCGSPRVLPSKHTTTMEVQKVLSQSDPIGISGAMTNSVAAIFVDGIMK
ncbi:hypothetical protein DVH24_001407 [Malus domestica]|uniref:Uncharacterized protein n=1 Tax=Malus domestica TaxID=3750 RepID=A0A498K656_MALDO|nr:hypothetical protein DVH24_001407 [Malus domestica]